MAVGAATLQHTHTLKRTIFSYRKDSQVSSMAKIVIALCVKREWRQKQPSYEEFVLKPLLFICYVIFRNENLPFLVFSSLIAFIFSSG